MTETVEGKNRSYHIDGTLPTSESNQCLVFGSNSQGYHSRGVAVIAKERFGAVQYISEGHQGNSYGIPTRTWDMEQLKMFTLPLEDVKKNIERFCQYTIDHSELKFFVTSVGCGLAGFTMDVIAPLFKTAINCSFPEDWDIYLEE